MSREAAGEDLELATRKHRNLKWIYKLRGYFYIPPLLVLTFCFWNEYENNLIIWPFGLSALALAFLIRIWAIKHIGRRVPRRYKNGRGLHLVATGPYSLVRNPMDHGVDCVVKRSARIARTPGDSEQAGIGCNKDFSAKVGDR